jgi:hypothetical protein
MRMVRQTKNIFHQSLKAESFSNSENILKNTK